MKKNIIYNFLKLLRNNLVRARKAAWREDKHRVIYWLDMNISLIDEVGLRHLTSQPTAKCLNIKPLERKEDNDELAEQS